MSKSVPSRRVVFGTLAVCLVVAFVGLSWEKVTEIDLRTGRLRTRTICCFVVLSEAVDSRFADLVDAKAEVPASNDWRRVSVAGTGPYYAYGGTRVAINGLLARWELEEVPIDQQKTLANYFLRLLQEGRLDDAYELVHLSAKDSLAIARGESN